MQIQSGDRWVDLTSSRTGTNVLWSAQSSDTLGGTGNTIFTFSYFAPPGVTTRTNWRLDNLHLAGLVTLSRALDIGPITVNTDGSDFIISWMGSSAGTYTVQRRTNLVSGTWENAGKKIAGVDGAMSATFTMDIPQAFFKLVAE